MADTKLTDLSAFTELANTDVFYGVDVSEGTSGSKKITIKNYLGATRVLPTGGDDTSVLSGALSGASAEDTILLSGSYSVAGGMTISANGVKLVGYGATITQTQEGVADGEKTITITGDRVTIEGVHFVGKGTEHPWDGTDPGQGADATAWNGVAAVYINAADSTRIQNCRFTNHAGGSIALTGVCTDTVIDGNHIAGMGSPTIQSLENGGDAGINFTGNTQAKNAIRITNNYITGHAFGMFGAAGSWVISHNVIKDIPGQHGGYLVGTAELTLSNNVIVDCEMDGFKAMQLTTAADQTVCASVTGNTVSGSGYFGISILSTGTGDGYYMENVLIANNNIYNSGTVSAADGLYVKGVKKCLITGNRINTSTQYGIYLRDAEATLLQNRIDSIERAPVLIWQSTTELQGPYKIDGLDLVDSPLNTASNATATYRSCIYCNYTDASGETVYIGNVHQRFVHESADGSNPPTALINANSNVDIAITGPLITESDLSSTYNDSLTDYYDTRINVKTYGALGDGTTNDATAIQYAIDQATAGQEIYFPPGTYVCNATIDVDATAASCKIVGEGVTLDFSSATISNSTCLRFYGGAQSALPAQTGDEAVGNSTWNLAAHGVAVGDVVVVENTTNASYQGDSNDYKKKERFVVREVVDADNFETHRGARLAWTAAEATWTKLPGATPSISGDITVIGKGRSTDGDYAITFENCTYPRVSRGVTATLADIGCFQLKECFGAVIDGCHVHRHTDVGADADCQAIRVESCQDVRITNCELHGDYNAVYVGGVGLNMDIHIAHCTLTSDKRHAVHCLGNICYSSVKDCDIDSGVLLGGNHNEVSGCRIAVETTSAQDAITLDDLKGLNMRFFDNYVSGCGASRYVIFADAIGTNTDEGGTCVVRNCFCETPAAADSGILFYFRTDGTGVSTAIDYEFSGVRCSNYGTASNYGFYVYHSNGTFPGNVRMRDCHLTGGIFVPNVTGRVQLEDVTIANATADAVSITAVSGAIDVRDVTIEALGSNDEAFILGGTVSASCDRITIRDVTVMGAHDKTVRVLEADYAILDGLFYDTTATTDIIDVAATVADFRCNNTYLADLTKTNMLGTGVMLWDITSTGTPAAVLAGSVGSQVRRIDGGTSTTLYIKETGTYTTSGWVAVVLT